MTECFDNRDEEQIINNIITNLYDFKCTYKVSDKDIDKFYENCFKAYDYSVKPHYTKKERGQVLMYIVNEIGNLTIEAWEECKDKAYKDGSELEDMIFRINLINDDEAKTCSKYFFECRRKDNGNKNIK